MTDLSTLARLIENLLRLGTVAQVQHQPPRVKVKTGALTTSWLPWLTPRAGTNREWHPPSVGEQVLLLSPSGQLANGVVLTGIFSELIPANGARADLHRLTYNDGAVLEYDSAAHLLKATIPGSIEVTASGNITLTAKGNVAINGARVDIN
jgi:phage baseplate assembly protein V